MSQDISNEIMIALYLSYLTTAESFLRDGPFDGEH